MFSNNTIHNVILLNCIFIQNKIQPLKIYQCEILSYIYFSVDPEIRIDDS